MPAAAPVRPRAEVRGLRFELTSSGHRTVLRAVFEDGDQTEGQRAEGAGTTIFYSGEDIEFDYSVTDVHPDLLGLLCLIIFYPFVGERVVFPMPVSPRLEEAFRNPNFKRQFSFDNVDPSLEQYSGSNMALAFGGGIDSSAVRTMFPEAYVVHEAHRRDGRLLPSGTHGVVHDWPLRVHAGTFDFCDDRWRPAIRERVLEHLDPMRPEEIAELETWDATWKARGLGAGRFASKLRRAS